MIALYARQSRDKKDSVSIESQFDFCQKEVPEGEKVKKYKDKGFSGKNIDRPDFQRLLKDIESDKISKVIVYRLDRMSRSTLDFAGLMVRFKKHNVDFISSTEKFDTGTPIGQAMLSIIMVFAELERKTIQIRITDSYYARGKKAMSLGGNVPFGFELKRTAIEGMKTNMLVATERIEYIKQMYNEYSATNASLGKISNDLNKDEVKTLFGNNWDSSKISRILKNPVYVKADADIYSYFKNMGCIMQNEIDDYIGTNGLYVYGKGTKYKDLDGYNVVIAPHEGVVDSYTWLKCQNKLGENKQIKNTGKSKYSWLSGLIKCNKCKYSMNINKANLSKKYNTYALYFRCSGRVLRKVCDADSVRVDVIESKAEQMLFEYINNLNNEIKTDKLQETKRTNELKIIITNKEAEIENLIDSLAQAKSATMKYVNKRLDKLDSELAPLREELRKESIKDNLDNSIIVEIKKAILHWDELTIDEKKEIASLFISKVYVENDIVKIEWKR